MAFSLSYREEGPPPLAKSSFDISLSVTQRDWIDIAKTTPESLVAAVMPQSSAKHAQVFRIARRLRNSDMLPCHSN